MAKKAALGKGIGSLIGGPNPSLVEEAKKKLQQQEKRGPEKKTTKVNKEENLSESGPLLVAIKDIKTNPNQPRKIFKEKELEELSQSIKENGVIQPLVVVKSEVGIELVAGERRLRASKMAGLDKVPVIVKRATEREKMIMSIIENVQRSDLNCVEEALAYYQLMDDFKLTQEEVAKKLGKERSSIANYLRILKLPRKVIELVQKDLLSFGHAKILASVKEKERSIRLANMAVDQGLSVRELEKLSKKKSLEAKENSSSSNPFFDEKLESFKEKLEKRTGLHFAINSKKNGSGHVAIKFSNEAEFNDIYEYLLKK